MKCPYCHRFIIPDLQEQAIVELPEGDITVHKPCGEAIKRSVKKGEIIKVVHRLSAALFLLVLLAFAAKSDEIKDEKDWVKGGVVIGITNQGGCVFKAFVKVGITDNNPDDDRAQILGYEPGNVIVSSKGDVIWERTDEDAFIPLGRFKPVHGRICKCPKFNL